MTGTRVRDFTLQIYGHLCVALRAAGHAFVTVDGYARQPPPSAAMMRHDVDRRPGRAVEMARLEAALGIAATYYFRVVPESWNAPMMREIAALGHEIGYHYEDLTLCRGDAGAAVVRFRENLARFREVYPVTTICMHGSPASKWDNRDLWQHADYREHGIIAEPYLDLDFEQVTYLSDTGRGWNQTRYSRRDFVGTGSRPSFASTQELIAWVAAGQAQRTVMINTHPERWTDSFAGWLTEVLVQAGKRPLKAAYIRLARARRAG